MLRQAEGKRTNISTDSRYTFATLHVRGAIYKERGLLSAGGKEPKNKGEVLRLLEALWKPSQVAFIHCKGHQTENDPDSRGNRLTDQAPKDAAYQSSASMGPEPVSKILLLPELPLSLTYT